MILISVLTNNIEYVNSIINKEYRLAELITVVPTINEVANIVIDNNAISTLPDWKNVQPPILMPATSFSENNLLGIIYTKLGNFEKAYPLLSSNEAVFKALELLNMLQNNVTISSLNFEEKSPEYFDLHNNAIALHYGFIQEQISFEIVENYYKSALLNANDINCKAFTAKNYALFLLDTGLPKDAESILINLPLQNLYLQAQVAIKNTQCNIWLQQLTVPYNTTLIEKLKDTLWSNLLYFEENEMNAEAALVLMDAAHIANITDSFSEALGYINKAINYFEIDGLKELTAQAQFTKGNILQTWAQNGNPQFYRSAVTAYQDALRIFTIEHAPDIFAEIQHQLGRVYAEIPDEVKKKGIWAAVSVSSFTEALNFYNKIDYPYQFAMICNNMGIAYTKYPKSLQTDNYDKALAWYNEALDIRTAANYPLERVLTLNNYIEASWLVGNVDNADNDRYEDMMQKLNEILILNHDEEICNRAKADIEKLQAIKQEIKSTI
jgi:tetratricopeptide (TPR) repeat protein